MRSRSFVEIGDIAVERVRRGPAIIKTDGHGRELYEPDGAVLTQYLMSNNKVDIIQGALAKGVLAEQGVITEAGFDEQAKSYQTMAETGRTTAASETDIAAKTDVIAGQQDEIAAGQQQLATATEQAGARAEKNDFISGAIKGITAIASIALAPATGGASLAVGAAAAAAMSGTGSLY